jgi:hypothetical protein
MAVTTPPLVVLTGQGTDRVGDARSTGAGQESRSASNAATTAGRAKMRSK